MAAVLPMEAGATTATMSQVTATKTAIRPINEQPEDKEGESNEIREV